MQLPIWFSLVAGAGAHNFQHAEHARWMTGNIKWGVMSTISTQSGIEGTAFGNPVSFGDAATGIPYMCVSPLDASIQDLAVNDAMSLTMSLAALESEQGACSIAGSGDPENPPCSRLVLSGTFQNVTGTAEWEQAKDALNSTHPAMAAWGCFSADGGGAHGFFLAKLEVRQAWLIDMYGGAAVLSAAEYFAADLVPIRTGERLVCPVSGKTFLAQDDAANLVKFKNGQAIYVKGQVEADTLNANLSNYLAEVATAVVPSRAGKRLVCPVTGETFLAQDDAANLVQFKNGQAIYVKGQIEAATLKANLSNYITSAPTR